MLAAAMLISRRELLVAGSLHELWGHGVVRASRPQRCGAVLACIHGLDPMLTFPNPPSFGIPKHQNMLHDPTVALPCCCAQSPISLGGCWRRVLPVGTDTILLLSKHPWQAIIRLFWC